jgi:hypothetical protein
MEKREQAMKMLRANLIRKMSCAGSLISRCFMSSAFVCLAAVSASAQTDDRTRTVVVTLLLSGAQTTDPAAQQQKYLAVAASGGVGFKEAKSWLYFDASALPVDIQEKDFIEVQLRLVPKEGAPRGMAITVVPAREKAPGEHTEPLSYSPTGDQERNTLVSPPLRTSERELELRSDSASLTPGSLLVESGQGRPRYIGILLLPQPNASRRVYYGLNSKDGPTDRESHPVRLPRLIITYRRRIPPIPPCAPEPSALAPIQSDGRPADTSTCNFIPRTDIPVSSNYALYQVATGTRTKAQVTYRDRLYVVRKVGSVTRLEELGPLGGLIASVPLDGEVHAGSPMLVDGFGRLRIITNDAIFTAQLGSNSPDGTDLPASVDKKSFDFGQVPGTVVSGPDGTLYIVKQSIFALNPDVGELDKNGKLVRPEKLWEVAISDEVSTRITLSPDGHFVYALARFSGMKSRFVAINAQTGNDVQLLPGKVSTSGKAVTWISGMKFDQTAVGQTIPIGSRSCTVETRSSTSLTCKEDLGTNSGVPFADFPDDLSSFRNPVVARGLKGVDFVYITGNSGSRATLWAVQNDPETRDGDLLARFTGVWKYPLEEKTVVGQPILDPTTTPAGEGLAKKKVYFLQNVTGTPKLTAISALDGTRAFGTTQSDEATGKWSTEVNPVVDSAGNIMLWGNNTLYGFTADTKSLFTAKVESSPPQLLFGPGGTLYLAYGTTDSGTTVSALIPLFQQSDAGPTNIYSPTHLYVTGSPARQALKSWILGARGSVLLGENFSVKMGETLAIRVNASQ